VYIADPTAVMAVYAQNSLQIACLNFPRSPFRRASNLAPRFVRHHVPPRSRRTLACEVSELKVHRTAPSWLLKPYLLKRRRSCLEGRTCWSWPDDRSSPIWRRPALPPPRRWL